MVAPLIQRKTLVFPGRTPQGGAIVQAFGIPDTDYIGSWHADELFEKESSTNYANVAAAYIIQDEEFGLPALRIDFPQGQGVGPVVAVAIAPDSVIQCCDIRLMGVAGEVGRHRVSPGNPLLGVGDAIYATVTIPNGIPFFLVTDAHIFFNAMQFAAGNSELPNARAVGWPLRLELWRGMLPPLRQNIRAPMFAHGILRHANGTDNRTVIACVDGRRRIDIIVYPEGHNVIISAESLHSVKHVPPNAQQDAVDSEAMLINGAATATTNDGVPLTLSFEGNSLTFIRFTLDPSAAGYTQVKMVARDDF